MELGKLKRIKNGELLPINLYHVHNASLNIDCIIDKWNVGDVLNTNDSSLVKYSLPKRFVEENLEKVRPVEFPKRNPCLYLTQDYEYWAEKLCSRPSALTQIVRVKLIEGILLAVDSNLVSDEMLPQTKLDLCRMYWEGEESEEPQIEYLFNGKFEIVEILK